MDDYFLFNFAGNLFVLGFLIVAPRRTAAVYPRKAAAATCAQ